MSFSGEHYDIKNDISCGLRVSQCGMTICDFGHYTTPRMYAHYSAHFILEGKGTYTVNGKTYKLSAGQGFMITPKTLNSYKADDKEPWKYIFISFYGIDARKIVDFAGITDDKLAFEFDLNEEMLKYIYKVYDLSRQINTNSCMGYDIIGYFMLIMSKVIAKNFTKNKIEMSTEDYLDKAVEYIEAHYFENISVNDIAKHIHIDRTYLYKIFKKSIGISPKEYLLMYRLKRAEEMMPYNMSICEIASATGFYDQSHFAKMFTDKYGISPQKHQKKLISDVSV